MSAGIYVLLDECYVVPELQRASWCRGGSLTECKEHVVVLGSLSKTYAMTGWRAGFALGPKPIIAAMSKLQSQTHVEHGEHGAEGVDCGADAGRRSAWRRCGRTISSCATEMLAGFKSIPGLTCTVPQGAFYVYPNVSAFYRQGRRKSASGPGVEAVDARRMW